MAQLVQRAAQTVITQDVTAARECAYLAQGIFEDARAKYGADELAVLGFLCGLTCLDEPIASALLMQTEGRYTDALSRIDEAIQRCGQLQQSLAEPGERPNCKEIVTSFEPPLRPFPALLRSSCASIEAELSGYQENIEEYLRLLDNAVVEYRAVHALRPSANPGFLQLRQLCSAMADRLESRSHNFEPMLRNVRYMAPSGDKILIIHGRNEGSGAN